MIGRVYFIHPSNQELYCLRQILMRKAGATSYADLRTHNHVQYETFTEAEIAMGLLDSDEEWELTLTEAFSFMTRGIDMRKLFCVILSQCRPGINLKTILAEIFCMNIKQKITYRTSPLMT